MGSFGGHILPGAFLLLMGFWWLLHVMSRYMRHVTIPGTKYRNSASFRSNCLPGKLKALHIEAILKIVLCTIGIIGEICTAFYNTEVGYKFYYGNLEHVTMFFFFAISGVFDLLLSCKVALPRQTDYLMLALAFIVEALIFCFHLDGRHAIDKQLHCLLVIVIFGNIFTSLIEMKYERNSLIAFCRTFFLILQGTWFCQIAFVLYSPFGSNSYQWVLYDESRLTPDLMEALHNQTMLITCMFAWHGACVIIVMFLVGVVFCSYYKCLQGSSDAYQYRQGDSIQLIKTGSNGKRFVSLPGEDSSNKEEESDVVYEEASESARGFQLN